MSEKKVSPHSEAGFIKNNYPEYWDRTVSYPADKCACIHKVKEEWGVLCSFGNMPVEVNGIEFRNSEHLFHIMKFRDEEIIKDLYRRPVSLIFENIVKGYETSGRRRDDWGTYFIDALKFCIMKKYEQNETFRNVLEKSRGLYIVELSHNKKADAYSVVLNGDNYEGYNLFGELLMELRDKGTLEYHLPEDALDFIEILKS